MSECCGPRRGRNGGRDVSRDNILCDLPGISYATRDECALASWANLTSDLSRNPEAINSEPSTWITNPKWPLFRNIYSSNVCVYASLFTVILKITLAKTDRNTPVSIIWCKQLLEWNSKFPKKTHNVSKESARETTEIFWFILCLSSMVEARNLINEFIWLKKDV